MAVIDVPFVPLIVTARPADPLYRQPPTGTDMGALRIVPATDVRPGDWVLGAYDGALNPSRLRTVMQSVACFPALPATVNDAVALDGESPVWDTTALVLIIPREYIPAGTDGDRSTGYRVGDRVERSVIYDPIHDDPRDQIGTARPVIQRGTVTAVDDGAFTVEWAGRWANGRTTETAMRLADPVAIERERAAFGFAVGDTVTVAGETSHGVVGVVLELYYHWYTGAPMARVYWHPSLWDNTCRYDFAETRRYTRAAPDNWHLSASPVRYDSTAPAPRT